YLSNVTGNWITAAEATDPSYWSNHLRQTVRFADGLQQLLKNSARILLEVGPGRTLTTNARRHPDKAAEQVVLSSLRHPQDQQSDVAFLLNTVGKLWLHGGQIDWSGFYANERRYRLPLPSYPFERQRYWIEPSSIHQQIKRESLPETEMSGKVDSTPRHSRPNLLKTYVAPRNELEQRIADAWAKSLGIEQVGIYDDFFELGGDSLLAVQLIVKLRDILQVDLSAHSLLNAPTIAALAELFIDKTNPELSNQHARQLPSTLVEIQTGDRQKPPLFLVHPVGGHVYFYHDLTHHLGTEQPVYGIQAQGIDGKAKVLTQVEKMATQYIEAIRVIQPEGPYFIGGSSFGGTVAFEMAQQLHAQAQQVALLAMIDTPGLGYMPTKLADDAEILAYLLEVGENILVSVDELRKLEPDEQLLYCLEQMNRANRTLSDLDMTHFRNVLKLFKVNSEAMWNYIPQVYPGRVIFFRAKEREAFLPHHPEMAWIDLAAEGIEIYVVPGNHITMNYPPHVQFLAKRLKVCLESVPADDYGR
ncbi:MAG: thioesterase domain-containing protein, partial [Candidatus Parabeggiatoa sp.]|nr:thioesterase domain-containing protein [Candidatus Parabeggiatoa sp.]